jgi:hypothetical protein
MSAHPHGDLVNEDVHHEASDINVRAILWFVGILAGVTIAIQVSMIGMFKGLDWYESRHQPYVTPLGRQYPAQASEFPEPRLQTTPWTDLKAFRADQHNYLTTYGWVDERLGVARIPIAKAKELLLQRGLPVRPELAAEMEGTNIAATGESSGGRNLPGGSADKSGSTGGGGFVSPDAAATPEPPNPAAPQPRAKAGPAAPKGKGGA